MSSSHKPRFAISRAYHELAFAIASRPAGEYSTVSLKTNAAGKVQVEVDVRNDDPFQAAETARKIFDELRANYPSTNGPV
jgi:hypothetical protein